jgi:nitrite reductase/ring-hydroxylating ferredoxin subunit
MNSPTRKLVQAKLRCDKKGVEFDYETNKCVRKSRACKYGARVNGKCPKQPKSKRTHTDWHKERSLHMFQTRQAKCKALGKVFNTKTSRCNKPK